MTERASGAFDVKMTPMAPDPATEESAVGRMTIEKKFHGDLDATSKGQMLAARTAIESSAGYVALELVWGTLGGRSGTFILQHVGTMTRGAQQLAVTVVPDSGTGELVGLVGSMKILMSEGKHSYEFDHALPGADAPAPSERIHQETVFEASPSRVYEVLTGSKEFSRMSGGAPAVIDPRSGGEFSCFGGMIVGRNLECVPAQRVVQAWRAKSWEPGAYSIVRFELRAEGAKTRLVLDQTGFPDGQGAHLSQGWHANYWEPLRKLVASASGG